MSKNLRETLSMVIKFIEMDFNKNDIYLPNTLFSNSCAFRGAKLEKIHVEKTPLEPAHDEFVLYTRIDSVVFKSSHMDADNMLLLIIKAIFNNINNVEAKQLDGTGDYVF